MLFYYAMKVLVVDDEFIALEGIVTKIKKLYPGAVVAGFRQADEALLFASSMKPEIAFLDIEPALPKFYTYELDIKPSNALKYSVFPV